MDNKILVRKLTHTGLTNNLVAFPFFYSYLSNRIQFVSLNGFASAEYNLRFSLIKDEEQRQILLQIVSKWRNIFSDSSKATLSSSFISLCS